MLQCCGREVWSAHRSTDINDLPPSAGHREEGARLPLTPVLLLPTTGWEAHPTTGGITPGWGHNPLSPSLLQSHSSQCYMLLLLLDITLNFASSMNSSLVVFSEKLCIALIYLNLVFNVQYSFSCISTLLFIMFICLIFVTRSFMHSVAENYFYHIKTIHHQVINPLILNFTPKLKYHPDFHCLFY